MPDLKDIIEDMSYMTLFPTLVWTFDLKPEVAAAQNTHLVAAIEKILTPRPEIQPGHGWQTHHDLHKRDAFSDLSSFSIAAGQTVLARLKVEPTPIEITGCWANISPPGVSHPRHHHANNYLSAVYYVQTGSGADNITFHDPRDNAFCIWPRYTETTDFNAFQLNVQVKTGRLVIFPSWLKHSVPTNGSDQERISIAINMNFSSFNDTMSPPAWQGSNPLPTKD